MNTRSAFWITVFLVLSVLASGVGVIYSTHLSRTYFMELQKLEREHEKLNTWYGKLLLEESALASPVRIENKARRELGLTEPNAKQTRVLKAEP